MAVVGTIFSLLVFFVSCTNSARPSNPDLSLQKDGASLAALGVGVPLWANVSKQCEYSVGNLTVPLLEKCEYLVLTVLCYFRCLRWEIVILSNFSNFHTASSSSSNFWILYEFVQGRLVEFPCIAGIAEEVLKCPPAEHENIVQPCT